MDGSLFNGRKLEVRSAGNKNPGESSNKKGTIPFLQMNLDSLV
jgi:hypothetical protein